MSLVYKLVAYSDISVNLIKKVVHLSLSKFFGIAKVWDVLDQVHQAALRFWRGIRKNQLQNWADLRGRGLLHRSNRVVAKRKGNRNDIFKDGFEPKDAGQLAYLIRYEFPYPSMTLRLYELQYNLKQAFFIRIIEDRNERSEISYRGVLDAITFRAK